MHLHGLQEILADRCTKTMAAFFLSNSDQFSPAGAAALAPLHSWVLILHRIVALHQIRHFVFQDQLFSPKASKIPLPQVLKCRTWGLSSYWDFQDPQSENSSRNPISWWALPWCLPWHLLMVPSKWDGGGRRVGRCSEITPRVYSLSGWISRSPVNCTKAILTSENVQYQ